LNPCDLFNNPGRFPFSRYQYPIQQLLRSDNKNQSDQDHRKEGPGEPDGKTSLSDPGSKNIRGADGLAGNSPGILSGREFPEIALNSPVPGGAMNSIPGEHDLRKVIAAQFWVNGTEVLRSDVFPVAGWN